MKRAHATPLIVGSSHSTRLERVDLTSGSEGTFSEAWLQNLIHENPSVLPLEDIEPAFLTPVAICMELPTKHGFIDNLLLTPDGDVVIVETKLWRNSEARRKVVAQALDYASCLFEMDYAELQAAALKGNFGKCKKPSTLHGVVASEDAVLSEARFEDAVNTNLRSGRIVILIVGDGIRTEMERLSGVLQSHGGFHFTLALVELAIYRLPDQQGLIVQPRTLARTELIQRGVVRIEDPRIRVTAPPKVQEAEGAVGSISAEQFFEAMEAMDPRLPERLKAFLKRIEAVGVYPDFQKSLNLRVDQTSGKSVNLGTIFRTGEVWTDNVNARLPAELAHRYNEMLAAALGLEVEKEAFKGSWHVRHAGKAPKIKHMIDKLDVWAAVIEEFVLEVRRRSSDEV